MTPVTHLQARWHRTHRPALGYLFVGEQHFMQLLTGAYTEDSLARAMEGKRTHPAPQAQSSRFKAHWLSVVEKAWNAPR